MRGPHVMVFKAPPPLQSPLTLNAEHLSQFESGASHFAQRVDDSLGVGLREEDVGVQDGPLVPWGGKPARWDSVIKNATERSSRKLQKVLQVWFSLCLVGLKVFLAASAMAPSPSPTARPAGGGGGANTQRQLIRAAERKEAIRAFGRGNNRVLQRAAQERRWWFRPSRLLHTFSHSRLAASSISLPRWPFKKINKSIYILMAVLSLVGLRLSVLEKKDMKFKVR